MTSDDKDPLIQRIKQELNQSAADLPPEIVARLRAGRAQALEQLITSVPRLRRSRYWFAASAAAVAASLFLAVGIMLWLARSNTQAISGDAFQDIEILATPEHPEFYEDIDFYAWLAAQQNDAS
jgi:hypothetical protein